VQITLPLAEFANLHFVTPRLAVGGDLSSDPARSLRQLAEICHLGITHVVDVRSEWSDYDVVARSAPQLRYLHHGMDDAGQAVPAEWFEKAVTWIEAAWAQDPDAIVLTHCHAGINRGPSLGFAVLLALDWDPVEAISAIRAARPQANV
jgi:dual specificity phosphatase 3